MKYPFYKTKDDQVENVWIGGEVVGVSEGCFEIERAV